MCWGFGAAPGVSDPRAQLGSGAFAFRNPADAS